MQTSGKIAARIRRMAAKEGLVARRSRKDGLWYIADESNCLISSEHGMDDDEALEFLAQK